MSQLKRCSVQCLLATVTNGPIDEEPNQNRRISIINDIKDITYLKGSLVFAKTQDHISETSMREWEQSVDTMVVSLKALNDQSSILTAYSSILKLAATVELTALQISAFYVLANAVSDSLMKLHPTNAPITSLIDAMTDTHLSFIDVLLGKQKRDDDYDGSE